MQKQETKWGGLRTAVASALLLVVLRSMTPGMIVHEYSRTTNTQVQHTYSSTISGSSTSSQPISFTAHALNPDHFNLASYCLRELDIIVDRIPLPTLLQYGWSRDLDAGTAPLSISTPVSCLHLRERVSKSENL